MKDEQPDQNSTPRIASRTSEVGIVNVGLELEWPASQFAWAALGWLGLGDWRSAADELSRIHPKFLAHPFVARIRVRLWLRQNPDLALALTNELLKVMPDEPECLIHRSFALHELARTQEAYDLLRPTLDRFPENPTIPYNIACYLCQLGLFLEAHEMLIKSFAIDSGMSRRLRALSDPELAPLWPEISVF